MKEIFGYIVTVSVYMTVFYLFYLVSLSKDTMYARNRFYLITSLLLAVTLPLISFNLPSGSGLGELNHSITGLIRIEQVDITAGQHQYRLSNAFALLLIIYLTGVVVSFSMLTHNIITLKRMIKKGKSSGSRIIYTENRQISGFSALGYIFLNNSLDDEESDRIARHEMKHLDYNHFADLLFMKLISVIFWFNPLVYLFEMSLKAVHEYQVDNDMIQNNSNSIPAYQELIFNQLFRTKIFSVQSAFSGHTLIKKRMIMMTKKKSGKFAGLKLLLLLPLITVFFILFSCTNNEKGQLDTVNEPDTSIDEVVVMAYKETSLKLIQEEQPWTVVEEMPTFDGGDINKYRQWVQMNVKYPKIAVENGIMGKVYVAFVINTDGSVSDAAITRGVDPSLDNEVIRVISSSPEWVAGKNEGKEVRVKMSMSINFQLQ